MVESSRCRVNSVYERNKKLNNIKQIFVIHAMLFFNSHLTIQHIILFHYACSNEFQKFQIFFSCSIIRNLLSITTHIPQFLVAFDKIIVPLTASNGRYETTKVKTICTSQYWKLYALQWHNTR